MALLSLNGVRKSFGSRTVLDDLDFAVEPQARVGVVGANGSGKSTLLRLLAGLDEPDAGTVVRRRGLDGLLPPAAPARRRADAARGRAGRAPGSRRARPRAPPGLRPARLARRRRGSRPMARVLRTQEELLERWEAAGGPSFEGRARALLLDSASRRPISACRRASSPAASGSCRARRVPRPGAPRAPPRRARGAPRRRRPRAARAARRGFGGAVVVVSHDRYLLDETVSTIASLDRGTSACGPATTRRTRSRASSSWRASRGLHDATEGDRAARGRDPPLQGLGAPRRRRAAHQAGT